ncbi:MAG: PEP-CTERM sorting domain-containing protein [Akkermansia sp.]|nr:PEP-CTERM sorting domain-containing protein [Akkermansia sp.]
MVTLPTACWPTPAARLCCIEGILQPATTAAAQVYTLVFDMAQIPEPATCTLSLLALAALATRRRRH